MTNKCADLELCRELWDRGLRFISEYVHLLESRKCIQRTNLGIIKEPFTFTPDTDELLAVMPEVLNNRYRLTLTKYRKTLYRVGYDGINLDYLDGSYYREENPSNALAKCLIWLIDNKYVNQFK